jgi:hypothetical protein
MERTGAARSLFMENEDLQLLQIIHSESLPPEIPDIDPIPKSAVPAKIVNHRIQSENVLQNSP